MTVETTAPRSALGWYPIDVILNHLILTFPSHDYTKTIKVLIGPEEQIFIIHTDVVCAKSRFFKAACSGRWKEGQEQCVRLPDVKPETFQCYVDWVYGGIFVAEGSGGSPVEMSTRLYVLGDILDDIRLRNTALKALTSYACVELKHPSVDSICWAWSNTPPHSLFRKWIVDATFFQLRREQFAERISDYPAEMVQLIALESIQRFRVLESNELRARLMEYVEVEDEA